MHARLGSEARLEALAGNAMVQQSRQTQQREAIGRLAGVETILLVEDARPVRELVERCLSRRGYRVLAAKSGSDALSLAEAHDAPIDLLLTDILLSGIDGLEVAGCLRGLRPGIRVVYMSGFSGDRLGRPGTPDESFRMLEKPFTPTRLLRAVRESLDGEPR